MEISKLQLYKVLFKMEESKLTYNPLIQETISSIDKDKILKDTELFWHIASTYYCQ
jgi:hypothetical protein